jgi:Ca-activated chloride channel family protein
MSAAGLVGCVAALVRDQRKAEGQARAAGRNGSARSKLPSDGEANTGFDLMEAAKKAAERGVRISVGVGTRRPTLGFDGWSMRVRLNEDVLKKIAATTEGDKPGDDRPDLTAIYKQLTTRIALEKKRTTEITVAAFVAIGVALAAGGCF